MNNEQNTTQNNDFEIIDIPTDTDIQPQENIEQISFDEPSAQSNQDVQTPVEPEVQPDLVTSEIIEPSFTEISTENNTSVENTSQVQQPTMNVYEPKNNVEKDNGAEKKKLAKSTKELILMAIIATIMIIFLPTFYNFTSGNYHIMDKIGNSITGLFNKKATPKKTENNEVEKEEQPEQKATNSVTDNETSSALSFDFSNYNNQIVDRTKIQAILDEYKNNIVELNSTVANNVQTVNIKIVKDKTGVSTTITNPDTDIANFKTQNLNAVLNYLVTVTNVDDNVITITAVQK